MKNQEHYMAIAVEAAKEAKKEDGVAIGAVIIDKDGEVIARGGSLVGPTKDPTAHAEVNCIRIAAEKISPQEFQNCTLYSTLEPCQMCLSAAVWAKIPKIYFGAYKKDVSENLFDVKGYYSDEEAAEKMNLRNGKQMLVQGGILEKVCADLLNN